ncbi:hypothetical protein KAZ92_01205, partial [Candidatus Gracilibacteria bacterium]|nr:hypothetical protein [Candidatus Gracilibacteria bacterium]
DLIWSAHEGNKKITKFCSACMDGKYPTKDITLKRLDEMDAIRSTAERPGSPEAADNAQDDQLTLI